MRLKEKKSFIVPRRGQHERDYKGPYQVPPQQVVCMKAINYTII